MSVYGKGFKNKYHLQFVLGMVGLTALALSIVANDAWSKGFLSVICGVGMVFSFVDTGAYRETASGKGSDYYVLAIVIKVIWFLIALGLLAVLITRKVTLAA